MAGYSEVVSPGWFHDDDTVITSDDDDHWLSTNLKDEHIDSEKILQEHQEQTHQPPTRPFATPLTDEEVEEKRRDNIPKKTQQDTEYCLRLWNEWRSYRQSKTSQNIPQLEEMTKKDLDYWLSRFVLEVRKKDAKEFPPNSLHHLCCGILRHLRACGSATIDFFKDPELNNFRRTLDSEMKRLQSSGLGSIHRQAEPISEEEENILWEKGLLGDKNPQTLLDTMVFMNGLYFALRSGNEHRQLRHNPSQIQLFEKPGERAYLRYTEDISKNHPGGLKARKIKPKIVDHHANLENPDRCYVLLYKLYNGLCPSNRPMDAFYLKPLKKPKEGCWYSSAALGHNTLQNTVGRLCKKAGFKGLRTNHSLRATTATRLYQHGVDEQLVMEMTGHRSVDGVRSYKRTSSEQREELSNILSRNKRPCVAEMQHNTSSEVEKSENHPPPRNQAIPCSLNFFGCSSFTVNIINNKSD